MTIQGAECIVCGRHFASDTAFDAHRVGSFLHDTRTCLDVTTDPDWRLNRLGLWTDQPAWTQRPIPLLGHPQEGPERASDVQSTGDEGSAALRADASTETGRAS